MTRMMSAREISDAGRASQKPPKEGGWNIFFTNWVGADVVNPVANVSVGGRGKGVWTADNQNVAATYWLIYNPAGRAVTVEPSSTSTCPAGSDDSSVAPRTRKEYCKTMAYQGR